MRKTVLFALLLLLVGCVSGPPTKLEQALFTIETNYVDVTIRQTNTVVLVETNYVTRTVTLTNEVTREILETNQVVKVHTITNTIPVEVTVTNTVPSYNYLPGSGEAAVKTGVGFGSNAISPGSGGVAVGVAGLIFGLWRRRRSGVEKQQ